jgi:3-hydroxyisobutyrate dehydrogenase-like beta-hydroxyacid dehydrogenase
MGAVLYGALLSALHGARVCEAEGLDIDQLATGLAAGDMDTIAAAVQDMLARIPAGRYGDSLGTLQTGADGAEQMLDHAREMGLDDAFAVYVDSALRRGIDAGLGDQDVAALIEVLRKSE